MTMRKSQLTVYSSAARTATPTAPTLGTSGAHGCHIVIDVTASAATPSVVPTIDGLDDLSGKWYTLLTGAAITGTGTTVLKIYPGITVAANVSASDIIPSQIRVVMTHADADSITYSVSAHLMG